MGGLSGRGKALSAAYYKRKVLILFVSSYWIAYFESFPVMAWTPGERPFLSSDLAIDSTFFFSMLYIKQNAFLQPCFPLKYNSWYGLSRSFILCCVAYVWLPERLRTKTSVLMTMSRSSFQFFCSVLGTLQLNPCQLFYCMVPHEILYNHTYLI